MSKRNFHGRIPDPTRMDVQQLQQLDMDFTSQSADHNNSHSARNPIQIIPQTMTKHRWNLLAEQRSTPV